MSHTLTTHNDRATKQIALGATHPLRIVLVYQAGIANVFKVTAFNLADYGRDAQRIYQGDFRTAESICYGMGLAGAIVRTAACNRAGDVARVTWSEDLDGQPFSESFHVQKWNNSALEME